MRRFGFLVSVLTACGVFVLSQGCAVDNDAKGDRICTPGAFVFCRCADRTEGTKLCKEDGQSFEACSTDGAGECIGGEIDQNGDLIDDRGEPLPPEEQPEKPNPSALEACPGKSTAVTPNAEVKIDGDTTGAKDDGKGKTGACAVGAGGGDHVYRLIPSGTGSLDIKVQGAGGMNPVVYVRSTCDQEDSQASCGPPGPGSLAQLKLNVVTGREYFLFVDGASSTAGKYTLTAKLTTGSFCGDGKVDTNEACDDGNKTAGDGCENDCRKLSESATANGCPGQEVHVWPGQTVTGSGTTTDKGNAFTKTGTSCTVSGSDINAAPEYVYAVTPHQTGNLKVTVTPKESGYNPLLVARRTCTDPNSQQAGMCANSVSSGQAETMTFSVTSGQKVYVAVDGALNSKGAFDVSFVIQ